MRSSSRLAVIGLAFLIPFALEAQRSGTAGTGGTGGQARGAGARGNAPSTPALPTTKQVTNGTNPASYLVEKRKKLGLDDATVNALKAMATEMDARYAEPLERYEVVRKEVNMARNQTRSSMGPTDEERQLARERMTVLGQTMGAVRAQRAKDVATVLEAVPEDKREAAKAMLDEQAEEMGRLFRRSGPEGAVAAGPAGGGRRP